MKIPNVWETCKKGQSAPVVGENCTPLKKDDANGQKEGSYNPATAQTVAGFFVVGVNT
jgi:hypothetical protein